MQQPTGLTGKASNFLNLAPAVIAVSETHLISQGIIRFKNDLKGSRSQFTLMHGHPAPYRSHSVQSYRGKQVGTGFLSTFPCRPLKAGWLDETFAASRMEQVIFGLEVVGYVEVLHMVMPT